MMQAHAAMPTGQIDRGGEGGTERSIRARTFGSHLVRKAIHRQCFQKGLDLVYPFEE
jgi:hypothetical protein